MKLSWNFKFALGTITLVSIIVAGIFLYASQLLGEKDLVQQIDFYQLSGLRQAKILSNKLRETKSDLESKTKPVIADFENWNLYQDEDRVNFASCAGKKTSEFVQQYAGSNNKTVTIDGLSLVITPNYNKYSNDDFLKAYDSAGKTSIGKPGVAVPDSCISGATPVHAYADKILWVEPCEPMFTQCPGALKFVSDFFKK